jgi:hypothetical protein
MSTTAYELGYLEAGLEILEDYLLSADLYWTIGAIPPPGEPAFRQLTLGGLLLNAQRLLARTLSPAQDRQRQELGAKLDDFIHRHPVAWERKASREFQARLKLWANFLNEYRDDPENHADRYAYEVERRVMLQLLTPYARQISRAEQDLLVSLDKVLEAVFVPGKFIWDAEVAGKFDREVFWYLYGGLRR